ncbi:MAG: MCE family protein [Nitrospinae bacterium]|nr:MCE family protein [Nitrospinota bacterium]
MKLSPEVKVGALTIAAGFVLLFLSVKTAGTSLFGDGAHMTFFMDFTTVAGVELKSKVKLSGVEIGYVEDVQLKDGYARVVAKLTREAEIRNDALATIRTEGLLGEKYIELVQGTPGAPPLKDGQELTRTQTPADISDMLNKAGSALEDISAVTNSLKNVFGTMEAQDSLKNIVANIETASDDLKGILAENRKGLNATINNFASITDAFSRDAPHLFANLERVADGLRQVIDENREDLHAGVGNLRSLSAEMDGILKENRENLKNTLARVATAAEKLDAVMVKVEQMSDDVATVTGRIEKGEGTVGRLINDEEVYDNLNATLLTAKKYLNKADEIRVAVGVRAERQTDTDLNKAYASLKIIPREDKYYLLELAEDTRRTDLTTTRNTINSLLYTLLMAKRFSDLTVRAGLIESSAGVGLDYHLFNDRIMASADLFNISGYDKNADRPQVKATLRWNFQKYLYLYLGGDEMLNDYYRTILFGGGVMFDEDDIKMALGLL